MTVATGTRIVSCSQWQWIQVQLSQWQWLQVQLSQCGGYRYNCSQWQWLQVQLQPMTVATGKTVSNDSGYRYNWANDRSYRYNWANDSGYRYNCERLISFWLIRPRKPTRAEYIMSCMLHILCMITRSKVHQTSNSLIARPLYRSNIFCMGMSE